jgi:hypothetical protein
VQNAALPTAAEKAAAAIRNALAAADQAARRRPAAPLGTRYRRLHFLDTKPICA